MPRLNGWEDEVESTKEAMGKWPELVVGWCHQSQGTSFRKRGVLQSSEVK